MERYYKAGETVITEKFAAIFLDELDKDGNPKDAMCRAQEITGIQLKTPWRDIPVGYGISGGKPSLTVWEVGKRASSNVYSKLPVVEPKASFTFTGDRAKDIQWFRAFLELLENW